MSTETQTPEQLTDISERIKRLSQHLKVVDPVNTQPKSSIQEYSENKKEKFIAAANSRREKMIFANPELQKRKGDVLDGSNIVVTTLKIGEAATTENGLPVPPGHYRLSDGNIITVSAGGVISDIERLKK